MSGTRFNSKLEDLASSVTVMTKEQMSDFAMLDINDIFNYTANTEGTGTYTDFSINRNGDARVKVEVTEQGQPVLTTPQASRAEDEREKPCA